MLHYGCQSNSLSNLPSIHYRYYSLASKQASVVVLNLAELAKVNADMKRCLYDLERCRRSIAGLLLILP